MVIDEARHDEIRGLLSTYALGAVGAGDRVAIEHHLTDCPACRRSAITHLESMALLVGEPLRLPPDLWDSMVERVAVRRHS